MSYLDNKNFALLPCPWDGDNRPSLFYIKKRNTGTGRTEVHVLSADSSHKEYSLHVGTGLHETHENFVFKLADWNGDGIPDLWAIKKWATGTGKTEVHIFSGASNFSEPIFHGATAQGETGSAVAFDILPRGSNQPPDLVLIQRAGTGSSTTELHIMSGASDFKEYVLHTKTGLHETGTGKDWSFTMTDWNGNGQLDLVAISAANGGELHALKGPDFQDFNLHAGVPNGDAQGVLSIPDDQWSVMLSCGAAAAGVITFWVSTPLTFGATAAIYLPTYLVAADCYRNIQKYKRAPSHTSGAGGRGSSNVDPFPHDRPRPSHPRGGPGNVEPPPPPPHVPPPPPPDVPPPFETEDPDDIGNPGPPPPLV